MRVLKDDRYNAILAAARAEFIGKGFKDASMRSIAASANVGLSNIYNYFSSKDGIFLAVVRPAQESVFAYVERQHNEENTDFDLMSSIHHQEKTIEEYIRLLDTYRDELRLLLYHSEGSSMKNFRDDFTEYLTEVSSRHEEMIRKHNPGARKVSRFFIHSLCAYMVSIVGEIVTHNLSKQKMREFFREYFKYETAGWRELIGL